MVACSGGADSLALLAATVFEARSQPWSVVGITVDHGLQDASAEHAAALTQQMREIGVGDALSVGVEVTPSGRGPEAAAREARYAALSGLAERLGAPVVLLGHTLDDQAETVLLGLARGSGGRSLAGMPPGFRRGGVRFARPLLGLTRAQTEQACRAEAISWWVDPHNADPRFTRVRARHRVLPVLEAELGPGVAPALARTAEALQEDLSALDEISEQVQQEAVSAHGGLSTTRLREEPVAISSRVLRRAAVTAGCPSSELFRVHVSALVELVSGPSSRGAGKAVQLPGHVTAYLDGDELRFRRTGPRGGVEPVGG